MTLYVSHLLSCNNPLHHATCEHVLHDNLKKVKVWKLVHISIYFIANLNCFLILNTKYFYYIKKNSSERTKTIVKLLTNIGPHLN